MRFKKLLNLSVPSEPIEAATKDYVDKVGKYVDEKNAYIKREVDDFTKLFDHVKKTIDERPHIIAVHTHYSDNLRKGEYQLTFGENTGLGLDKGFLVPQSGRIKRYKQKSRMMEKRFLEVYLKVVLFLRLSRSEIREKYLIY